MNSDYAAREYLSAAEVAHFLGVHVRRVHDLAKRGAIPSFRAVSGQYRFRLDDIRKNTAATKTPESAVADETSLEIGGTRQRFLSGDARRLDKVASDSVHLAVTSPPYFNAKMYSENIGGDLGNMHDLSAWLAEVGEVWREVFRVLAPGRKFFLNIMNLPVRENGSFRALNLVGKNADLCEQAGFVFKRDIIWHKTNGVRAHFGSYPYPGGILINQMHESILEFEKPARPGTAKYAHISNERKEDSKMSRDFWLELKNSDVWLMKPEKSGGGREHASPFPLELPRRLILAYSYIGETVLDPFLGSGTTLLAAAQNQRDGVGCEINPDFFKLAVDRVRKCTRARKLIE